VKILESITTSAAKLQEKNESLPARFEQNVFHEIGQGIVTVDVGERRQQSGGVAGVLEHMGNPWRDHVHRFVVRIENFEP
jgi:hypothetical protein